MTSGPGLSQETILCDMGTRLKQQGKPKEGIYPLSFPSSLCYIFVYNGISTSHYIALEKYQQAVETNPEYAPAYYNIGIL